MVSQTLNFKFFYSMQRDKNETDGTWCCIPQFETSLQIKSTIFAHANLKLGERKQLSGNQITAGMIMC